MTAEACWTWLAWLVLQLVGGIPEPKLIRLVGAILEPKFLINCLNKQNQHFCQHFS